MNFNFLDIDVLIYTIFILLVGVCSLWSYGKSNQKTKKLFLFLVFLYFLIGGLRSRWVGSDTNNYVFFFSYMRDMSYSEIIGDFATRDPIAMIFFKFISAPFQTYTPVLLIIQFIFCFLIAITYYKYSKNCILAFLIFVFLRYHFFLMSGIRQGLALCLILYSYKYLIKEKLVGFIVVVALASMFHLSAILFLLIYPIKNIVFYNKGYRLVLAIVITFISTLFIPGFVNAVFVNKSGYLSDSENFGNLFSLVTSTLIFILVHLRIRNVHVTKEINILYNITLVFFLFSILSFRVELAFREAMYFGFIVPIAITHLVDRKSINNLIVVVMLILYSLTGVPISVDPYQFYWNESEIEKMV